MHDEAGNAVSEQATAVPSALEPIADGDRANAVVCELLERSNLFGDLAREGIATLAKYTRAYRAPKDAAIFVEGTPAGFMCIVVSGRVRVFRDSGGGRSKVIAHATAGNTLGEMSMFDGLPPSATAVATEPTLIVALSRRDFTRLVDEDPKLATRILWRFSRIISERLRETSGMLVDSLDHLARNT